jgi:hypothetical protein
VSEIDDELAGLMATPMPDPGPGPWPDETVQISHAAPANRPMGAAPLTVKLAGVTFSPGYPQSLIELGSKMAAGETVSGTLRREPDNPHDPAAVAVWWRLGPAEGMLGHLPRSVAGRIAPELDSGQAWDVVSVDVLIDPMYPDRPGATVRLARPPSTT